MPACKPTCDHVLDAQTEFAEFLTHYNDKHDDIHNETLVTLSQGTMVCQSYVEWINESKTQKALFKFLLDPKRQAKWKLKSFCGQQEMGINGKINGKLFTIFFVTKSKSPRRFEFDEIDGTPLSKEPIYMLSIVRR